MQPQAFDLVIVGGGMTGLALAAGLANTPWRIALIEAQTDLPDLNPDQLEVRVSALSEASRQLLEQLGAWSAMTQMRVTPYQGMQVWDAQGSAAIEFNAQEVGVAHLGYMVENLVTVQGLWSQVKDQPNLTFFQGATPLALSEAQDAQGLRQLRLDSGELLEARLVVAADGARSNLREWAGFETREWDYGHHALVASVRTEKAHGHIARQRFNATGPLAFLPFMLNGDDHWSSIVWSTSPEEAAELQALDESHFNARLAQSFEARLGRVEISQERQVYPLRQRHAKTYVKPGIALMGDAAHTIHPLAGQGVNLGFQDVVALTQVLQQAASQQKNPGCLSVLSAYQTRRQPENLAMMAAMESFKRLFASQTLPVLLARNLGMRWVDQNNWIKRRLVAKALGLKA